MRRTAPERLVRALAQPRIPVDLEQTREDIRERQRKARRTRLHFFGLAGGRRRGQ